MSTQMKVGLVVMGMNVAEAVKAVRDAEADGFASVWFPQIFGLDAMTACALAGASTDRIQLGTMVVPTYPRHPYAMAQQAASTNDACGGRFTLGIGLSHQVVIERMFGLSFAHPAKHMAEYLAVVMPMLREGAVQHSGDLYKVAAGFQRPGDTPSVVIAALGPKMLALAGTLADGTATWDTGPKTLASHIVPSITAAATAAGRPAPRIVAEFNVCVTDDPDAACDLAARLFNSHGQLPSYRAMLEREGVATAGDIALIGSEDEVTRQVDEVAAAGVTEFAAGIFGSPDEMARTRKLLATLASR